MSVNFSLRTTVSVSAISVAVAAAGPAFAAHTVVQGSEVYTFAAAGTGDAAASADIRNGVLNPASNYAQGMATTQTQSLTPNGDG